MKTNHIAFYQFCSAVRRKGALALCLALCVLRLGLSASARERRPSIITFDAPGAAGGTIGVIINDRGVILGQSALDANSVHNSFLRAPDGSFTPFDAPGVGTGNCQGTNGWGLNQEGAVAGTYEDASGLFHGFLRDPNGRFKTFDAPGAGTLGSDPSTPCNAQGTVGWAINPAGAIAGFYADSGWVAHGFLRTPDGRITPIDAPGAGTSAGQGTSMDWPVHSINPAGAITGWYYDASWVGHGFLRAPHGKITTIDAPGAGADPDSTEGTFITSINADGTVVGYFQDTNWLTHGFSRSPDGKFTTFDAPGEGTVVGSWEGTWPHDINLE